MDKISTILGIIGSLVSIIAFIISLVKNRRGLNIAAYVLLLILTGVCAYCFYKYEEVTAEKLNLELRKESVKIAANQLLESSPYVSYFNPGKSEGLILSTLALLEENRDIYPETFQVYKDDVVEKLQISNHKSLMSERREELELAGEAALHVLKTLAGK